MPAQRPDYLKLIAPINEKKKGIVLEGENELQFHSLSFMMFYISHGEARELGANKGVNSQEKLLGRTGFVVCG